MHIPEGLYILKESMNTFINIIHRVLTLLMK